MAAVLSFAGGSKSGIIALLPPRGGEVRIVVHSRDTAVPTPTELLSLLFWAIEPDP